MMDHIDYKNMGMNIGAGGVSFLAVWLPGMSTWGSIAIPIISSTPIGTIALVPLISGFLLFGGYYKAKKYGNYIYSYHIYIDI
jgi:hypothetical protein